MSFLNYFLLWTGIRLVGAAYLAEWSRLPNAFALDRHHGNELGEVRRGGGGMSPRAQSGSELLFVRCGINDFNGDVEVLLDSVVFCKFNGELSILHQISIDQIG